MNRREFLLTTAHGLGVTCLVPVGGCVTREGDDYDPGPYRVGSDHLVFDEAGSAYILDVHAHRILRLDERSRVEDDFGSPGAGPGQLNWPIDAAFGPENRLYVLDRGNHRIQVFDAEGRHLAVLATDELHLPRDILVHGERIYVCDTLNHRVLVLDLDGKPVREIGRERDDDHAVLNGPRGIAVDSNGDLHVLDGGNARVQVFAASGEPLRRYGGYGAAPGHVLGPCSILAHGDGRMFVADPTGGWVHVFAETGAFLGRFRARDRDGTPVPAFRVSRMPDGALYVWTAGHALHRAGA